MKEEITVDALENKDEILCGVEDWYLMRILNHPVSAFTGPNNFRSILAHQCRKANRGVQIRKIVYRNTEKALDNPCDYCGSQASDGIKFFWYMDNWNAL